MPKRIMLLGNGNGSFLTHFQKWNETGPENAPWGNFRATLGRLLRRDLAMISMRLVDSGATFKTLVSIEKYTFVFRCILRLFWLGMTKNISYRGLEPKVQKSPQISTKYLKNYGVFFGQLFLKVARTSMC